MQQPLTPFEQTKAKVGETLKGYLQTVAVSLTVIAAQQSRSGEPVTPASVLSYALLFAFISLVFFVAAVQVASLPETRLTKRVQSVLTLNVNFIMQQSVAYVAIFIGMQGSMPPLHLFVVYVIFAIVVGLFQPDE